MSDNSPFSGFSPKAIDFLRGLSANNDRAWFADHKDVYEAEVLAPMRALLAELGPAMLAIDPEFDLDPRSGAVSRIYRDIRFSRDKSPFRPKQWIVFKRQAKDWAGRPAFFLEFGPNGYRHGLGYYAASARTMAAVRARLAAKPGEFLAAMAAARGAGYGLEGELYKRPRPPLDQPEEIQQWHRRKNVCLVRDQALDQAFHGPALTENLKAAFAALAPLYRFLVEDDQAD